MTAFSKMGHLRRPVEVALRSRCSPPNERTTGNRQTRTSPRLLIRALSRGRESRLQVSRFRTNLKGDSHGYAAREFPFRGVVGGNGGNSCLGAKCRSDRRGSEHRTAKRRILPGFLAAVGAFARPRPLAAGIMTRPG